MLTLPAMKRIQAVKAFRLASKSPPTQKLAATPTRFHVHNMPGKAYLLIPRVSSERREFVPMGYIDAKTFTGDSTHMVTDTTSFHLGVLSSTMHNAWVRATCGRLKSDYRYSKDIVYNNFPWPVYELKDAPAEKERAREAIKVAAQAVLDARAEDKSQSLADLYDPLTMPPTLRKAHQKLDKAVDAAYGYDGSADDAARVAFLFGLYQQLTGATAPAASAKASKARKPKQATTA
jgi:hypothetical protein